MTSNEYRILLASGHIDAAADHLEKLQNMLTRPVDGDRLIELAVREGLAGLLYKNLIKAGLVKHWGPCDWERLGERTDALGQQKAVACILFLLANLFDYQPPFEARIPLGKIRLIRLERMILKKRSNGQPLPQWSPLLLLSGGKGLHKRLAVGFEILFPRPEILRQVFSDASQLSVRQIYWKRVRQLAGAIRLQNDNQ